MTQDRLDSLDLSVSIDTESGGHDVPDTLFPAPKYFVRTAEKPSKVILLHTIIDSDDDEQNDHRHPQHVSGLKEAMERDISESCGKPRWTVSKSQRVNDEWNMILDSDPI